LVKTPKADVVPWQVRLPKALHAKLAEMAKASDRSLNSEIVWALVQHAGQEWIKANLLDLPYSILHDVLAKVQEENKRLKKDLGLGPDEEIPE
jgi:hypothetical protein